MGTGFTIDSPVKIARYGISSVLSIGDDILIEQMRKLHSERHGLEFKPIPFDAEDARARRITAYLDLLQDIVDGQMESMRSEAFEPETEITKFFEMLPESDLRHRYDAMLGLTDAKEKRSAQDALRQLITPGSIDVNIMTKVDFDVFRNGKQLPPEDSVALSAMRGFAKSKLHSSVVLSAGMNRRLFGYMTKFDDFYPDADGLMAKKIVLKISDFRSARLQGMLLAKQGLWISEYRIESGLNCGGHAFASNGHLLGPILDEIHSQRQPLYDSLLPAYHRALAKRTDGTIPNPTQARITVQGGIGTAAEDLLMREYYHVDGTGWGTPFLLVPEVTNVDDEHLKLLVKAREDDVELSHGSPLGVRFWSLKTSSSETGRRQRIADGRPGSSCPKGYLKSSTEFTDQPLCPASTTFQTRKSKQLSSITQAGKKLALAIERALAKTCLCQNLASGPLLKNKIVEELETSVCCGPNIVNFADVFSLSQVIDHIYGRQSIMNRSDRPHMLITELKLYVDHLKEELRDQSDGLIERTSKYFLEFKKNLLSGIEHYQEMAGQLGLEQRQAFVKELEALLEEIEESFSTAQTTIAFQKSL
jgi:hypothetical protein